MMSKPIPYHTYSLHNSSVLFSSGFPTTTEVATTSGAIKIKQLIDTPG